jgi:hypothetical protein
MLSPIVNTDVKMSAKMLEALGLHETRCIVTGVKEVSQDSVMAFLTERFGKKLASKFEPKFLFNNPSV